MQLEYNIIPSNILLQADSSQPLQSLSHQTLQDASSTWQFSLRKFFGCPFSSVYHKNVPIEAQDKAHFLREAGQASSFTWNIWRLLCPIQKWSCKYDFSSVGYWYKQGSSRVWGPRNLFILTTGKRLRRAEQTKSLMYYKINAHQCSGRATLLHVWTNVAEKTLGNIHINMALLPHRIYNCN